MRKDYAVFAGKKKIAMYWTEQEAINAVANANQHVRWFVNGRWVKVEYSERSA
jgi:hypothetical protein